MPANSTATANDLGQAVVPNFLFGASASDACTPDSLLTKTQTPAAGSLVGVGTTVVVLSVVDSSGNSSACTVNFTVAAAIVADTTPPVVECPGALTVSVGREGQACMPNFLERLVASDNVTPTSALVKNSVQRPARAWSEGLIP